MVASDRISTYDVVHPTPIPDKGKVLTGLSVFWFAHLADIIPNHYISATDGVPAEARGRGLLVERLEMLPVECVVRGYITGSGWKDYQRTGAVSGIPLPEGLQESERLPEPIFTPSTKADRGPRREHLLRAGRRARRRRARRAARGGLHRPLPAAAEHAAPTRDHPRRHQVRVRPRLRRPAHPGRRGADARLLPLLARRPATSRAARSRASTSSTSATGPPRPAGTRPRRRRRSRRRSSSSTRARYVQAYELVTGEPFAAWLNGSAP